MPQQQQLSRHSNSISNLHSAFDISSWRSQLNIYIDVRERRPLLPHRACCSAARRHRFASATLLTLRCVEHAAPRPARIALRALRLRYPSAPSAFAPRHPGITLRLLCLRYSAAPSAFAPRHPASLCGCYAYETPPRRARSQTVRSAASPHHFVGATPTILRHAGAEYAALLPGRIWSRPLSPRIPIHDIHIHSFDPTHKFEFQLFVSTIQVRLACG